MKVLVYGSGGRDHCLADSYGDSQNVDKVYLVPGNPGVLYTPKGKRGLIEIQRLNDFGEGSANAMILLLILVVFLIIYVGVVMRRVEEE